MSKEVEEALALADEENENSISHGKSFNASGWAKKVLASEVRTLRAENEAMRKYLLEGCSECKGRAHWRVEMCEICRRGKALSRLSDRAKERA